jgi:hypothetical protein
MVPHDPAPLLSHPLFGRRDFLRIGALGLGGLAIPEFAQFRAASAKGIRGKAKRCLILANIGGPAHQDTFDLKPNAPPELRGEFKPIATNVAGIQICEHLPRLARHADKLAIIRSVHTDNHNHSTSEVAMFSGVLKLSVGENNSNPDPSDHPTLGSILWKLRGKTGPVPPYVFLGGQPDYNAGPWRGETAGWLGAVYNPLAITKQDYNAPSFRVSSLELTHGMTTTRMDERRRLLQSLDRTLEATGSSTGWNANQESAFRILASPRVRSAFDLQAESPRTRDRYGRHSFGHAVLLARRLLEKEVGVSCVTVHWTTGASFDKKRYLPIWDTHYGNFPALKELLLPTTDQTFSALLEDLQASGLLDETLIVWLGDFGRTPKINKDGGRDHWGSCFTVLMAGGGIQGGQVYGASDRTAAFPRDNPVTHGDIHATIYHALGIDSQSITIPDPLGRPMPLHDPGKPIAALFR